LTSTSEHLGTAGYLSSATLASSLTSTLQGLVFWTGDQLASTIDGSNGYIRTSNLESTSRYFLGWRGVFKSSLNYQGTPLYQNFSTLLSTQTVNGSNWVYGYLSTFSYFSLQDFLPYVRPQSRVVLEYSPTIMLTRVGLSYTSNYSFTTELRYNNNTTTLANSVYTDSNYWFNADVLDLTANNSNWYRRNMTFSFTGSQILELGSQKLSFIHYLFVGSNNVIFVYNPVSKQYEASNVYFFLFRDQNFTNLTPPQNSLFVSIYN
jgi:hypothetical protein